MRTRLAVRLPTRALVAGLWLCACGVASAPAEARAQAAVADRYRIDATLDPERREVRAEEQITWTNRSRVPVQALFFHLYANAFASDETVFMREQGTRVRGGELAVPGGVDVVAMTAADGSDLLARARTDLAAHDATQMRVDLPAPLAPGARIELDVHFRVRLPSIVARMGAARDFFMLGQWFPKLCKLEPDGRWASFPYHGLGEFYADFADYDLTVRAPRGFVIAAPGALQARADRADGMHTERYLLRRAVDVAWAASTDLERVGLRRNAVDIEVFAPRGHRALARAQAALLAEGLAYFSRAYGAYPHPRLVLVLPPRAGHGAAGMEYPGMVMGWSVAPWTELNPGASVLHDLVTAHELAHQWFALLLASDEVETPVLDEGLAEWASLDFLRARYGRAFWQRALGVPADLFEFERAAFVRMAAPPSSLQAAYRYRAHTLGTAVYMRPALALESVRRTWGAPRLSVTLGAYARAHRFGHPTLSDLWAAFDRGYYTGFAWQVLEPALAGRSADAHIAGTPDRGVRVEREGTLAWPVSVEVARERATERVPWPAGARSPALPSTRDARGLRIDPERHDLLDRARGDDQRRLDALAPAPPLLARALLWAQALLAGLGP
jgi:hypothetical protein